jgi:hypothetical protein
MVRLGVRPVGVYRFPDGSGWVPDEKPAVVGFRPNPGDWEGWGKTSKATIFVGLKSGRKTRFLPEIGTRLPERVVYSLAFGVRTDQVGTSYGGSFIKQKGHYIPPTAMSPGPERKRREDSIQVVVFPAPDEPWRQFKKNIFELGDAYLDDLAQESVIVEFVKDGRVEEIGKYSWISRKRR